MAFVAASLALFVYRRGQDQNWDLLNYHFFTGYAYLNGRGLQDVAPAGLGSFLHPAPNVFSYLCFSHLAFPYSAWAILGVQLLSVPALVGISTELGTILGVRDTARSRHIAWMLSVLSPAWISELGTSFFSSSTAVLILWGLFLLLWDRPPWSAWWLVSGAMFGLAVGLKLTNGPFAVAALVTAIWLTFSTERLTLLCIGNFVIGLCGGFLLTAGWYWYLWTNWSSPIFPLYNKLFKSPYFDLVNLRDYRWHFESFEDFSIFLVQAAFGTKKTIEPVFADARLVFLVLLLPGALVCKSTIKPANAALIGFSLFFLVGFALWAQMFAYQRYLIPLELLVGLVIWVLLVRLVEQEMMRVAALLLISALSVWAIKIPEWGHVWIGPGSPDVFGISIPERFASTPARYLVIGQPSSYILPSLHPDSQFFGLGVSKQMDEIIGRRLAETSALPVRLLKLADSEPATVDAFEGVGIRLSWYRVDCDHFRTHRFNYEICELIPNR
jgi:hypothetical protein